MPERTVKLKTKPDDLLFEFADDGVHVYVGHRGGVRLPRHKVEKLCKALTEWLTKGAS